MAAAEGREPNPYVGPRPFEQADAALFFGRRREVRELLSLIVAHRVVLLYASSGAGKSSLLNAGLIPMLAEEKGFQVLAPARVGTAPEATAADALNVYTYSVIANWVRT